MSMEPTMSEDKAGSSKPFDPFEQFHSMRDAYLDGMAKVMVDAVNTEGYAQATGAMLENSLTISAPFRDAMEKSMLQVLQQLSLPSRQDFAALADRFTNMEMRLDDMDRSEEHTSELQSLRHLVCRLLLEKKKNTLIKYDNDRRDENAQWRGSATQTH